MYDFMVSNPSSDPWFCSACKVPPSSSQSLSCICLNARSIVTKRLDFLAYVYALQPDVVAVTETF